MEKFGKLQLSEDANPSSCGRRTRSCKNHSIDSTLGFNFDPDMTEFESEFWSILVSLLSPDKNYQDILDAVENAVKLINNLYPTGLPATHLVVVDFFWSLWEILLEIVKKVPYNHLNQEILVDLLMSLRRKRGNACVLYFLFSHGF
jgi:hypothetical protein